MTLEHGAVADRDQAFMAQAIALAEQARVHAHPNPAVGCIIVRQSMGGDPTIVGTGYTQPPGQAHAEVVALQAAADLARGATAYVTLEPCAHFGRTPPCSDALINAGVGRVVYATPDPNPQVAGQGAAMLAAAGVQVSAGVLSDAARLQNRGFMSRFERGRPFVSLKLAASLDGRTAMASGESQWITGAAARADVHRRRALAGAVGTSIDTLLADDPRLTVRHPDVAATPTRVVFDTGLRTPAQAALFAEPGPVVIVTSAHDTAGRVPASYVSVPRDGAHLDLHAAMRELARLPGAEVNELFIECGPRFAGAILQAGLVDELVLYLAPKLLGDTARGLMHLPGLDRLADAPPLTIQSVDQVGDDLRVIAKPERVA